MIGHRWHPYFSEHTGIAECVRVSKNLQSNSQQQNNLRPELFWGMSGVDLKITTIRDSGISGYKSERFTGKTRFFLGWTCYTCENTSLFSRKSRVLHTFEVCAPTGVYKRKGGPRSSHYFAFSKILSTIYVYGDGNTTCVHTRIFIKKVSTIFDLKICFFSLCGLSVHYLWQFKISFSEYEFRNYINCILKKYNVILLFV